METYENIVYNNKKKSGIEVLATGFKNITVDNCELEDYRLAECISGREA